MVGIGSSFSCQVCILLAKSLSFKAGILKEQSTLKKRLLDVVKIKFNGYIDCVNPSAIFLDASSMSSNGTGALDL